MTSHPSPTAMTMAAPSLSRPQADASAPGDLEAVSHDIDRIFRSGLAKTTLGLSAEAIAEAYFDWLFHLASAPGTQALLVGDAWSKMFKLADYMLQSNSDPSGTAPCIEALPGDKRFQDPSWKNWPFNLYSQSFLLTQQWLHNATADVRGVSKAHEKIVSFTVRQLLDTASPSNFLATNPTVLNRSLEEHGANLFRGARHVFEDLARQWQYPSNASANPAVGVSVAVTPGRVVLRNRIMELIQYEPATEMVRPEPVVIVPAWIMKYYILDLSPQNSLVRYLVANGFTVFLISWRNPGSEDRDLTMADYLELGVDAAIEAATSISGADAVHATGYCLGGTLLSIAAAAMARDHDTRLRSLSLFAAQHDFTEAGELTLFVNSSQIALLEDMMWREGYLEAKQMAGAFQLLRSNDLIWSSMIQTYLLGDRPAQSDLMAWNADATRMPAAMHGEYLQKLFLDNDLAEGRYVARGAAVAISDIKVPVFAVGTTTDHVAPWQSAYKLHLLTDVEITFTLTSGGHNAGIVSEPGHRGRSFQIHTRAVGDPYLDPQSWLTVALHEEGSWWPAWVAWLENRSGALRAPPPIGRPDYGYPILDKAPGSYVRGGSSFDDGMKSRS